MCIASRMKKYTIFFIFHFTHIRCSSKKNRNRIWFFVLIGRVSRQGSRPLLSSMTIMLKSGYWGSKIRKPHTIHYKVTSKCGSFTIGMVLSPRGAGIVAARVLKKSSNLLVLTMLSLFLMDSPSILKISSRFKSL